MSSIKELKKDIHYVTTELVIECMIVDAVHAGTHESKLSGLVSKLIDKRMEFFDRINAFRKMKKEQDAAKYFGQIRLDLKALITEILEEVENLNK